MRNMSMRLALLAMALVVVISACAPQVEEVGGFQIPDRSGLPSGSRGAGAERLGLPSAVRGTVDAGTLLHCAAAGEAQTSARIVSCDQAFTSASSRKAPGLIWDWP